MTPRDRMVEFYERHLPPALEVRGHSLRLRPPLPDHATPTFIYACPDFFTCPSGMTGLYVSFTPNGDDPLTTAHVTWQAETARMSAESHVLAHEADPQCQVRT